MSQEKRNKLGAQANAYLEEQKARNLQSFENGRLFERERQHFINWTKLFLLILAALATFYGAIAIITLIVTYL